MSFIISEYGLFALAVFAGVVALIVYPLFMKHMTAVSQSYVRVITGVNVTEQDVEVEPTLPDEYHVDER